MGLVSRRWMWVESMCVASRISYVQPYGPGWAPVNALRANVRPTA